MNDQHRSIEEILMSIQNGYDKLETIEKDLAKVREKKEALILSE